MHILACCDSVSMANRCSPYFTVGAAGACQRALHAPPPAVRQSEWRVAFAPACAACCHQATSRAGLDRAIRSLWIMVTARVAGLRVRIRTVAIMAALHCLPVPGATPGYRASWRCMPSATARSGHGPLAGRPAVPDLQKQKLPGAETKERACRHRHIPAIGGAGWLVRGVESQGVHSRDRV